MIGRGVIAVIAATTAVAGAAVVAVVVTQSSSPSPSSVTGPTPAVTVPAVGASAPVIPPPRIDNDVDGLDDNFETTIAQKYAPVLFFDAEETSYPTSVAWLLGRMKLQHREDGCAPDHRSELKPVSGAVLGQLVGPASGQSWNFPNDFNDVGPRLNCQDDQRTSLSTVESLPDGSSGDGVGDEQNMQLTYVDDDVRDDSKAGNLNPAQWETYVHVYPSRQAGIIVQYWHTFAYNPVTFDTHEGDWDASLQVQLDPQLHLAGAWFSRHSNDAPGRFVPTANLSLFNDTHIEEAIDSGGHGAYVSPQDWCSNPDTVSIAGAFPHLSISWPDEPKRPVPQNLAQQHCSIVGFGKLEDPTPRTGGTIWFTWAGASGGSVQQAGPHLAQALSAANGSGSGLVNVGECNPGHQASTLNEHSCRPLGGQSFIQYSGQWGTTRGLASSPRGPVFQGFSKDAGQYESWYNDAADAPRRSTSATGGANAPSNVTVVPANGSATVTWQPPASGVAVSGYRVDLFPYANDRVPAPTAGVKSRTVDAPTASAAFNGLVEDCHQQYTARVTALTASGASASASTAPFRPSGIVGAGAPPPYVVILLDGISESKPGFTMDPYKPTLTGLPGYCPEGVDSGGNFGANAFKRAPAGPAEFFSKWSYFDPTDTRSGNVPTKQSNSTPRDLTTRAETHRFMLDAVAATGAVILPFSYSSPGARLSSVAGAVRFTYPAYTACNSSPGGIGGIGCSDDPGGQPDPRSLASRSFSIKDDVQSLANEIVSVQAVWPGVKVVVVGHSQGGLVAYTAWRTRRLPEQVVHLFSLDSPINGVCPRRLRDECLGVPDLGYVRYDSRVALDAAAFAQDSATGNPFRFVGTWGDEVKVSIPVLGGPSYGTGDETLQHQLLVRGSRCVDAANNPDCPDEPSGPDHISECRIPGSGWINDDQHFIVKFCPQNVDFFNHVLGLDELYALHPVRVISPGGAIGTLQVGRATEEDVRADIGPPDRAGRASLPDNSIHYRVLGYGCSDRPVPNWIDLNFEPDGPPSCQTAYYINEATKILAGFWTSSTDYQTTAGTKAGMALAEAQRREGRTVTEGKCYGITVSKEAAPVSVFLNLYTTPSASVGAIWVDDLHGVGYVFCT